MGAAGPTPGIDWRDAQQLALCRDVFGAQQALEFPSEPADDGEYWQGNGWYPALDALVLQAMLRHLTPARVIEVGCGFSSRVTARVNREILGGEMRFTCIDPVIRTPIQQAVEGITEVRQEKVQDTPLSLFDELGVNDVLFIDTSHIVETGGDVPLIYNQILPRLKSGVVVHLHDAFLPGDYPEEWVKQGRGWNEVYLLQSFLAFNAAFEIVFGVRWMMQMHRAALEQAFGDLGPHSELSGALWIRRV